MNSDVTICVEQITCYNKKFFRKKNLNKEM